MRDVRERAVKSKKTETTFGEGRYQARTWNHECRVIIKAEVVALEGCPLREKPRFLVEDLRNSPRATHPIYAQRGDLENRITEPHDGLDFDRTGCSTFLANRLGNLLTAATQVLDQSIRRVAAGTEVARGPVC